MTKKDFKELAVTLRYHLDNMDKSAAKDLLWDLCIFLRGQNDKFNEEKFIEACGLDYKDFNTL